MAQTARKYFFFGCLFRKKKTDQQIVEQKTEITVKRMEKI